MAYCITIEKLTALNLFTLCHIKRNTIITLSAQHYPFAELYRMTATCFGQYVWPSSGSSQIKQKIRKATYVLFLSVIFHKINFKCIYEGHLKSKERFAIQRYLLIIGKKQNMQVL